MRENMEIKELDQLIEKKGQENEIKIQERADKIIAELKEKNPDKKYLFVDQSKKFVNGSAERIGVTNWDEVDSTANVGIALIDSQEAKELVRQELLNREI